MPVLDVVLVGIFGVLGWRFAHPSEEQLRERGEAFARRHLAFVDSAFVPLFDRITRWSYIVLGVAFFTFGAALMVVHWADRRFDPFPAVYASVVGIACTAWAIVRLNIAGREFPVVGKSALARPRRVTLTDYVPPLVQAFMWLALALVVAFAAGLAGPVEPWQDTIAFRVGSIAAAILLVLAGGALLVVGRAMCERPQPAADPCHLYFQDAWRGEFLLGAFAFVSFGAFAYLVVVSMYLELPGWLDVIGFQSTVVLGAGLFAVFARSRRYFRARLWPTLLPGQVLLPGEQVPPRDEVAA